MGVDSTVPRIYLIIFSLFFFDAQIQERMGFRGDKREDKR